jgi:hypothetical protein
MLFFRHPRPVIDGRAVAVQIAQRKAEATACLHTLIVDRQPGPPPADAPHAGQDNATAPLPD